VADQGQHEVVVGRGLARHLLQYLGETRARRVAAEQAVDVRVAAGGLEDLVQIFGRRGESLLVIGFSHQPGNGDVETRGARGRRKQQRQQRQREDADGHLHTMPHFLRSSHSVRRSSTIANRNTGMFHNSLVSRAVTPASEKAISSGRLDRSCGRQ